GEAHVDAGLRDADASRFAEQVRVAELHSRSGFGRPVEDAGSSIRERVLDGAEQFGWSGRRTGVGLFEARQIDLPESLLEDPRPDRGDAIEPRGAVARGRVQE